MFEIVRGASPEFVTVSGNVAVALMGRFPNATVVLERFTLGLRSTFRTRLL